MQRGYTLPEVGLALAVAGLLLGIALPKLTALQDSLAVEAAAREVIAAHGRARMAAVLHGRPVVLTVSPDSLACRFPGAVERLWRRPGPAAGGVTLASPARQLTFSPVGISMGFSNATFRLLRGAASRTVIVSRLGRVRVTRP